MRRLAFGAALIVAALPVAAHAQDTDPNRRAYGYALRCLATATGVISDPRSSAAQVTAARERSRRAFDAGVRMGRVLGLSGQRISDDMDASGRSYAALHVRDDTAFQRSRAECARLGF